MSEVKLHTLSSGTMSVYGEYVLSEDYDCLAAENERLKNSASEDLLSRLIAQLEASEAENYQGAVYDIDFKGQDFTAVVILQYRDKPTPHDLRLSAERERDQLRAELEALKHQQAEHEPAGYFVQPYTDRPQVIERVYDSCAGDDDVFPLYRQHPSVAGLVEALEATTHALSHGPSCQLGVVSVCMCRDCALAISAAALAAHRAKGGL